MMQAKRVRVNPFKRPYVVLMMDVIGRSLEAASQVDERIQNEVRHLPDGLMFEMKVMPDGPALVLQKTGVAGLKYLGNRPPRKPDVVMKFKHLTNAFLVFSFQEATARAFANDRILLDGEIAYAMKLVRCLNRMESLILPKIIAERALKRYPTLSLPEKMLGGARIYTQVAKNFIRG